MSLTLQVNNQAWSNSLKSVIDSYENCLVPVIKGNGYGIGKANLANKSLDLGLTEIAIGTIFEAKEVVDKEFAVDIYKSNMYIDGIEDYFK